MYVYVMAMAIRILNAKMPTYRKALSAWREMKGNWTGGDGNDE